ncbi:MAG: hypothetical protein VW298_01575, partial [Candidatus Woesearchaeota archaeon]
SLFVAALPFDKNVEAALQNLRGSLQALAERRRRRIAGRGKGDRLARHVGLLQSSVDPMICPVKQDLRDPAFAHKRS